MSDNKKYMITLKIFNMETNTGESLSTQKQAVEVAAIMATAINRTRTSYIGCEEIRVYETDESGKIEGLTPIHTIPVLQKRKKV